MNTSLIKKFLSIFALLSLTLFSTHTRAEANIQDMNLNTGTDCEVPLTGWIWVVDPSDGNGDIDKDFDFNLNLPASMTLTNVTGDVCGSCGFQTLNWSGNRIWGQIQSGHINAGMQFTISGPTETLTNWSLQAVNIGGNTTTNQTTVNCDVYDFGDAPTNGTLGGTTFAYPEASHTFVDTNGNDVQDIRLGNLWDDEPNNQPNSNGLGDDGTVPGSDDEDGFSYPSAWVIGQSAVIDVALYEDTGRTGAGGNMEMHVWIDWDRSGTWNNTDEHVVNTSVTSGGVQNFVIPAPASATPGITFARVRVCSAGGNCDTPSSVADDGEVEDYRLELVSLGALTQDSTCDRIVQTSSPDGDPPYTFSNMELGGRPLTFTDLTTDIQINNLVGTVNENNINAIGFNRNSTGVFAGLVYGVFTDDDSADRNQHLFVTDKTASTFIDLGPIKSDVNQTITVKGATVNKVFDFKLGDYLRLQNIDPGAPAAKMTTATAGDVSPDGSRLVLWRKEWSSFILVDLRTQTFISRDISATVGSIDPVGADLAYGEDGNIYMLDLVGGQFYTFDMSGSGSVSFTTTPLNYMNTIQPTEDTNGKLGTGGLVIDNEFNLYGITNGGNHDTDNNGTLDTFGQSVVYKVNILNGNTEYIVATDKTSIQGNDAAGCVEARDYGDAAAALIEIASHAYNDNNGDNKQDPRFGDEWDTEFSMLFSDNAIGDDRQGTNDEDGIVLPAIVTTGTTVSVEVTLNSDGATPQLHVFSDWDRNNDWDDILIYSNNSEQTGTFTIPITIPGNALTGYSYLRFRTCSTSESCNTSDGAAGDGEVEDYRILISDLVKDTTCDMIAQSQSDTGSVPFTFNELDITTNPISLQNINPNIQITGFTPTEIDNVNALGFNRINGLFYGTFAETITTTPERKEIHLYVTDKNGQTFYDLGVISAAHALSITNLANGNSYDFVEGDFLRGKDFTAPGGLSTPTAGDISSDGQTMVLWRKGWDSLVIVDLRTQTFTTQVLIPPGGVDLGTFQVGADLAISAQTGNAFIVSLEEMKLYEVDISTGVMTMIDLVLPPGFATPTVDTSGKLGAGGIVIDDAVTIYAITNGGNHDTQGLGFHDLTDRSVVYSINAVTGDLKFVIATSETSFQGNDAGGCYDAYDYGDAPSTYGIARHHYLDSGSGGTLTGLPSVLIGNLWDSELGSAFSTDGLGDDNQAVDDEDIVIPSQLAVNELFDISIPVSVNGVPNGFLNMWVDINGDGDFTDANEHLLRDENVTAGVKTFTNLTLVSPGVNVYSGPTFMRLRMCQTADTCNEPTGTAPTGEVEDHALELLSRIHLQGTVFEDNGAGVGVPHNGILDGDEVGIGNFEVRAILNDTGVPGFAFGDVIATTPTSGDGNFDLFLPVAFSNKQIILEAVTQSNWIDISEADTSGITQVIGNTSVIDSLMILLGQSGDDVLGLDFGKVGEPMLVGDNFTEAEAGQTIEFFHRFTSQTEGTVVFDLQNIEVVPNTLAWNSLMIRDNNCDESIDPVTELLLTNADTITVNADDVVCILVKTFIPAGAPFGSMYNYDLTANMTFLDPLPSGHGITRNLTNNDTIVVSGGTGSGQLEITKEIIDPVLGIVKENTAKPGDTIEYLISFKNVGSGVLSNIVIFDVTPPSTRLAQPIDCTSAVLPVSTSGLSCNVLTIGSPNAVNYQGALQWILNGFLAAGESGSVRYTVSID